MSYTKHFILPLLLVACLNNSVVFPVVQSQGYMQIGHYDTFSTKDYKLLAAIPDEDIYLYAMDWKEEELKNRGVYRDILLDLKRKQRYFPCWIIDTNPSFKPYLILNDMNKDGKNDLVIITTKETGTGILIQEVHVFDIDTFNDIYVMNPIEAIYQNVKTSMKKVNGIVNINIKVKDKLYNIKAKESSSSLWYNDVAFGSNIQFKIINNRLIANVGAQVAFGLNCGSILMEYEYKNKRLEVTNMEFEKLNYQSIFTYKQ